MSLTLPIAARMEKIGAEVPVATSVADSLDPLEVSAAKVHETYDLLQNPYIGDEPPITTVVSAKPLATRNNNLGPRFRLDEHGIQLPESQPKQKKYSLIDLPCGTNDILHNLLTMRELSTLRKVCRVANSNVVWYLNRAPLFLYSDYRKLPKAAPLKLPIYLSSQLLRTRGALPSVDDGLFYQDLAARQGLIFTDDDEFALLLDLLSVSSDDRANPPRFNVNSHGQIRQFLETQIARHPNWGGVNPHIHVISLVLHADILKNRTAEHIFKLCPNLRSFQAEEGSTFDASPDVLGVFPQKLQHLVLFSTSLGDSHFQYATKNCKNIVALSMHAPLTDRVLIPFLKANPGLRDLHLSAPVTDQLLTALSSHSLRTLQLISPHFQGTRLNSFFPQQPKLEALFLGESCLFFGHIIRTLSQHCKELRRLEFLGIFIDPDEDTPFFFPAKLTTLVWRPYKEDIPQEFMCNALLECRSLESLSLAAAKMDDASMIQVLKNNRDLSTLDIQGCPMLTDETLLGLCAHCPQLKVLKIGDNTGYYRAHNIHPDRSECEDIRRHTLFTEEGLLQVHRRFPQLDFTVNDAHPLFDSNGTRLQTPQDLDSNTEVELL